MKRSIALPIFFLAILATWASYTNCGSASFTKVNGGSTVIGNPMAPVSSELMFAICGVINRCNPQVSLSNCQNGISNTVGFATPLGLSTTTYSSFSSITQGEQAGALIGNQTAANGCYGAINTLSCSDPAVLGAYNPSLSNPFSGAPGMVPSSSCNQVFSSGVNLEVPIEMTGQGLASNTTPTTFSRTRTSLNAADYDGTVSYAFEVVATNTDTVSRNVSLVDAAGTTVVTIAVPPGSTAWNPTRLRSSVTAAMTSSDYRIKLDATPSANQLQVWVGRIIVNQVGATQTKIFVPLIVGGTGFALTGDDSSGMTDNTNVTSYAQLHGGWTVLWQKNNAAFSQLASTNPWTFEAVLSSDAGSTVSASVFDATTGLQVNASEVSTTSATPVLVSSSFADASSNFNDLDNMEVEIKNSTGGSSLGYVYRAGLWIKLTNLAHAEVYYRYGYSDNFSSGSNSVDRTNYRILPNVSLFNKPVSIYSELTSFVTTSGTSCTDSLFDNGQTDTGNSGTTVTGSTFTVSSTTVNRQRSSPLAVTAGDRFTYNLTAGSGSGQCVPSNAFLVIGF